MRLVTPPSLALVLVAGAMAACGPAQEGPTIPTQAGLPNPASVYCEGQGGRVDIRQDASGAQTGYCVFADGSECEEWALFRNECQPARVATQAAAPTSAPAIDPASPPPAGWEVYTHPNLGYSFYVPVGGEIETDEIDRSISYVGPLAGDGHWPLFGIAHPNLDDYHPPQDADLQTWLVEHNRLPGRVVGTRFIAGEAAIHTRNDNGPQACDDDRYYFVHAGQVYEITVMHTAEEDWSVYDVFLDSFRF
jgi:hypothetical protein